MRNRPRRLRRHCDPDRAPSFYSIIETARDQAAGHWKQGVAEKAVTALENATFEIWIGDREAGAAASGFLSLRSGDRASDLRDLRRLEPQAEATHAPALENSRRSLPRRRRGVHTYSSRRLFQESVALKEIAQREALGYWAPSLAILLCESSTRLDRLPQPRRSLPRRKPANAPIWRRGSGKCGTCERSKGPAGIPPPRR